MDKVRKLKINNEKYSFKLTNRTVLELDEKYENAGSIFDGLMNGKQFYTNAIKILSCSCIDKRFDYELKKEMPKRWELEELADLLTGNQMYSVVPSFATQLFLDYVGVNDDKDYSKNNKKN